MSAKLLSPKARGLAVTLPLPYAADSNLVFSRETVVGPLYTLSSDTEIGRHIREYGEWASGETQFFKHLLRPGMNVIDVGANIGYFTRLASDIVGSSGHVLAIEPVPSTVEILRANAALASKSNISILPIAIGDAESELTIWMHPSGNVGGSRSTPFAEGLGGHVRVLCLPLDDVVDPDVPVDVIKIDIEGMDHLAIEGMQRTIRKWKPVVLCEFNVAAMAEAGIDAVKVIVRYGELGLTPRLLGSDLRILQAVSGADLSPWLDHDLMIRTHEEEFVDCVRPVHLVNLVLTPMNTPTNF